MLYTRRSPKSPNRVGIIHKKIKRMDTVNKFQLFVSSLEKKKLSGSEESLVLTNSMELTSGTGGTNRSCSNTVTSCDGSQNRNCTNYIDSGCTGTSNRGWGGCSNTQTLQPAS